MDRRSATPNRLPPPCEGPAVPTGSHGRLASRARWYVPRALGEDPATRTHRSDPARSHAAIALLAVLLAATALAACGGGDERQDQGEPEGDYPVEVTESRFPPRQRLAETSDLRLGIENIGEQTVPDLAVTIWTGDQKADDSFEIRSEERGLADPNRPVWILEHNYPKVVPPGVEPGELDAEPSAGAEVAQTATFAFGALGPGESTDLAWRVTPVMDGTFTVHYELAAGLQGDAKAVTADGSPVRGEFVVTISDEPPQARIDEQGRVEREE